MTATGSSLIKLQNQSCARERSIYVCGELLILGEISNSPHTYMDRSRAQECLWSLMSDDSVAVIYSASLSGAISRAPGPDGNPRTFA